MFTVRIVMTTDVCNSVLVVKFRGVESFVPDLMVYVSQYGLIPNEDEVSAGTRSSPRVYSTLIKQMIISPTRIVH